MTIRFLILWFEVMNVYLLYRTTLYKTAFPKIHKNDINATLAFEEN